MRNREIRSKRSPYAYERLMYPDVLWWLQQFLQARFPNDMVQVADTSRQPLYRYLRRHQDHCPLPTEWQSWDVRVDLVGLIFGQRDVKIAVVECKNTPIRLTHLSQLLGYSRVIQPESAFLLSPIGITPLLQRLLVTFGRQDILNYATASGRRSRSLVIAKWDATAKMLDRNSVITSDDNIARL
ncbi:MAG: hypothetical protein C4335_07925 [Armatimonadota bacterium]